MFELQVRPIDQWPRAFTKDRKRGTFTNQYGSVMKGIKREIDHLNAKSSVLLMALEPDQIRIDGRPRAGESARHPGVILVIETPSKGTLRFPCDTFDNWTANLRSISLHLEALRRIDRYGISVSGEQYKGFAALPSPNGDHWTKEQAAEWLASIYPFDKPERSAIPAAILRCSANALEVIRQCEFKTHPDKGGNPSDFHKVQQARKLLLP